VERKENTVYFKSRYLMHMAQTIIVVASSWEDRETWDPLTHASLTHYMLSFVWMYIHLRTPIILKFNDSCLQQVFIPQTCICIPYLYTFKFMMLTFIKILPFYKITFFVYLTLIN